MLGREDYNERREGGESLQLSVWLLGGQTLLVIKLIDCLDVIIIFRPDSRAGHISVFSPDCLFLTEDVY